MSQPQQPGKILRWVKEARERIAYLAQQEKQELEELDKAAVGTMARAIRWDYIRELGFRKNELQELLKKTKPEDLSAPASPVEESAEEFEIWANEYANKIMVDSPRAFREHLGAEIHSALNAARRHLTESKPSPVIEIGEQKGEIPDWFKRWSMQWLHKMECQGVDPKVREGFKVELEWAYNRIAKESHNDKNEDNA